MEQLTLEQVAITYHNNEYGNPRGRTPIDLTELQHANNIHAAFKAGAEWQKEQVIDVLLLAAHFVMNATAHQWDIDHYKEKFVTLLKPLQQITNPLL